MSLSGRLSTIVIDEEICLTCGGEEDLQQCSRTQKPCGHHCNHAWTHDRCCWCGQEWGEQNVDRAPVTCGD